MTIEEIRQTISARTGVPAELLTGETTEEIVSRAKALIALKTNFQKETPKTQQEQLADFLRANFPDSFPAETAEDPLDDLAKTEEEIRVANGGYSRSIKDASTDATATGIKSPQEAFTDFINSKLSYDPFIDPEGWKKLL